MEFKKIPLKKVLLASALVGAFGALVLFFSLLWALLNLPKISSLQDYSPSLTTRVLARDGRLIGEFFTERRYLVAVDQIPEMVVSAFTSAEDDRFFTHPGIDIQGIFRAFLMNLKAGHVVQGGSTITQQVAKSLLLSPERSFSRKFKEVLLAYKMEQSLTKRQILYLYLNQIYLGEGAYGVEAASRVYFHKSTKDLTIAEAALLAGLVQAPSKYSPLHNPTRARERQMYVLRRMHETGHISADDYKKALSEQVKTYYDEDINAKIAPYYVEHIRQYLSEKYGKDRVYTGGIVVDSAADYNLSIAATQAVRDNLLDLDKRQGYRGPVAHLDTEAAMLEELKEIRADVLKRKFPFHFLPLDPALGEQSSKLIDYTIGELKKSGQIHDEKELLIPGEHYKAVVTHIDPDDKSASLLIGAIKGKLALKDMRWAKRIKPPELANWATINRVSEALKAGDEVLVRLLPGAPGKEEEAVSLMLEQEPLVQGALLSMDAATGYVVAMVGGYDFESSEYNRAIQGERQPGSSFKPFLYASAIDKGFTPSSIIVDSPIVFDNQGGNNLKWIPENNSEKFYGDTPLRTALINSRNVPAVKLLQEVQVQYFINYIKALGINGAVNGDLSLALGSKTISLLELTKLYALFPRLGMRIEPVFVLKVADRNGQTLEQYSFSEFQKQQADRWLKQKEQLQAELNPGAVSAATTTDSSTATATSVALDSSAHGATKLMPPSFDDPLRAMDERTAFVMSHLLQEVVQYGTGTGAKVLKRHVGGKTGTTNEFVDAWFMGFSPELVTGVWTGFDTPRTLGHGEVGGRAALPAWTQYMSAALSMYKQDEYIVPKGIVFARIDSKTGALASPSDTNAVKEAFVEGTEPSVSKPNTQTPDSTDFFREDL